MIEYRLNTVMSSMHCLIDVLVWCWYLIHHGYLIYLVFNALEIWASEHTLCERCSLELALVECHQIKFELATYDPELQPWSLFRSVNSVYS